MIEENMGKLSHAIDNSIHFVIKDTRNTNGWGLNDYRGHFPQVTTAELPEVG